VATTVLKSGVRYPLLSAVALLSALTVIVTWPVALHPGTRLPGHDDTLFSIWRLSWIAHALRQDPRYLFDANIFYPHARTLAYSDAMLLEGTIAAPFLWAHVNPVLVYNLMFLAGIVSSGAGMFVLARYLTGDIRAALVAAAVFTLAPYRIEHFIHLELQWTVWMPLTLWAMHRTFDEGTVRFGLLTGLFLWLQILSCVYYGAFLGLIGGALAVMLMAGHAESARRAIGPLSLGALLARPALLKFRERLNPPPTRQIPVLIGGGGERKTLRLVAEYADIWHSFGDAETHARKSQVLREWCEQVGRDPDEIEHAVEVGSGASEKELDAYVDAGATHLILAGSATPEKFFDMEWLVRWRDQRNR